MEKVTSTYGNNPAPNRYQRREGCTLTPLMEGKIQYGKMIKVHNIDAIRKELQARSATVDGNTGWLTLIKLLKENESNSNNNAHDKYFCPVTAYDNFRWNEDHF